MPFSQENKELLIKTHLKNFFQKILKNDKVEFFIVIIIAVSIIATKGVSGEGQKNAIGGFVNRYVDETVASAVGVSQNQLADLNSIYAQNNSERLGKRPVLSMIQDNSVISYNSSLESITDGATENGNQIAVYEIQDGDTLSFIGADFGVSVNTIIWANNLKNAEDIRPGMQLKIPPVSGVIHKVKKGDSIDSIAKKYGIDSEKIISFNSLPKDGTLQIDQDIIVPGGKKYQEPTYANQTASIKRFAYLPDFGQFFMIPTTGRNWGIIHGRNGVDIANSCGTPVYASADGTITTAKESGWNGGFGKFIKIGHDRGTETLYGHLSKLLVGVGEYVSKGQQVALIGTTGRSTGCHLHFEVHGAKNPLARK